MFFDLAFAFGVSQLSHHLVAHLSWRGVSETLVMMLTILTVWCYTSWAATMIPAEQSRTRWMVLSVMLPGLFLNASVTKAFTSSGWAFVIPLLLIQLGRTIWTIANSSDAFYRDHYSRVLLWLTTTAPLWIGGAVADPESRILWWGLAASLELIGTWLAHPTPGRRLQSDNVAFDSEHMLERCRLFLLIALGETVITTGTAIADTPLTPTSLATGTFALAGTVALWAPTFGRTHQLISQHLEETSNPIRASRYAVNTLMVLVAGLVAVAVANEMVIAHPIGHSSIALGLLLAGGPIFFLAAQSWYLWTVLDIRSHLHLGGIVVLGLIALATQYLPPYAALILTGVTLLVIATLDQQHART